MINVKFSDEKVISVESGATVYDAAQAAELISREVLCATVNGEIVELSHVLDADAIVTLHTFADEEGKNTFRHTASHILAQAVKRLYPETKLTIGPSVENGFYYDFDSEISFTPDILAKIEGEMKKIVKENLRLERSTKSRADAIAYMQEKGEPYKVQLIEELPEGAEISFYTQGEFTDLCAGPHLFATGAVKAFKLTSCTGAYWRGDSKNKMLQRIYGTAFPTKDELKAHLEALEEARKRDTTR